MNWQLLTTETFAEWNKEVARIDAIPVSSDADLARVNLAHSILLTRVAAKFDVIERLKFFETSEVGHA